MQTNLVTEIMSPEVIEEMEQRGGGKEYGKRHCFSPIYVSSCPCVHHLVFIELEQNLPDVCHFEASY